MKELEKNIDVYWTIAEECEYELSVKKSRFIAQAFSVNTKQKAEGVLDVIRKTHYNANHNCFAYVIGQKGLEYRYSDDGEPTGTAGKPILFMINKYNLKDIIVIVTRYFGGTKLGIGGLSRAYSEAASGLLESCKKEPVYITKKIKIFCGYEDISSIKSLLSEYAVNYSEEYLDSVMFIADIPVSLIDAFSNQVVNVTSGRAGLIKEEL
jgi:uncharacterized YigZ family protein